MIPTAMATMRMAFGPDPTAPLDAGGVEVGAANPESVATTVAATISAESASDVTLGLGVIWLSEGCGGNVAAGAKEMTREAMV